MKIKTVELENVNSFEDLINFIVKDVMEEDQVTEELETHECPYDLENPLKEGDGFKTLIPSKVFDNLVEARKLLIESTDLIRNEMKRVKDYIDDTDHYGRTQILIIEDKITDFIIEVNTMLCINNEFKNFFDQTCKEEEITPQQLEFAMTMDFSKKRM